MFSVFGEFECSKMLQIRQSLKGPNQCSLWLKSDQIINYLLFYFYLFVLIRDIVLKGWNPVPSKKTLITTAPLNLLVILLVRFSWSSPFCDKKELGLNSGNCTECWSFSGPMKQRRGNTKPTLATRPAFSCPKRAPGACQQWSGQKPLLGFVDLVSVLTRGVSMHFAAGRQASGR